MMVGVTDLAPRALDPDERVHELEAALGEARGAVYELEERLRGVDQMLDEPGWTQLFTHAAVDGGLTLEQIRLASQQLRELVAGNPLLKRGSQLRATYVWGGGVSFATRLDSGKPSTITAEVRKKAALPRNRRYVFSNNAHEEFERAAFTDGNLFLLGDDDARTIGRVGMEQITGDLRNPKNPEEVWLFRREWDENPEGVGDDAGHTVRWYYTDLFPGARKSSVRVTSTGKLEPVDKRSTMLHVAFNQQVGWAYGIPDALPVIAYMKLYREFLKNGYVMSKALAQLAFKVTAASASAGTRAAAEFALPGQGSTSVMGAGNDISAVATAGKGYDFASGKPLAATIAAGLEVSVNTLLAEEPVGDQLDITTRAAATMRRLNWEDAFERIYAFLGNTRELVCTWQDLPVEQIQRQMQAWTLVHQSGAFPGEVVQRGIARTMKIADSGALPAEYVVAPGGTNPNGGTTGAGGATDGTGQGQGADSGGSGNSDSRGEGTD